jgi:hypothetical protein
MFASSRTSRIAHSGVSYTLNAAFCGKGSNKTAVNGAVRSTAQLHRVPHCL